MPDRRRRRSGAVRMAGRARSLYLARRLGIALRDSRLSVGLTQARAAERAGVSQGYWSYLERGGATSGTLETLAACAAAVGTELAAFVQAAPGADLPRDIEHVKRQELIIAAARLGGWTARPERPIDPASQRSRAIDVELARASLREIAVIEVWDFVPDVGHAMRGLADKVAAVRREMSGVTVAGLFVLRSTARNRSLVADLRSLFATRFPASSRPWLEALGSADRPMPHTDGLVWTDGPGTRLYAVRLGGPLSGITRTRKKQQQPR